MSYSAATKTAIVATQGTSGIIDPEDNDWWLGMDDVETGTQHWKDCKAIAADMWDDLNITAAHVASELQPNDLAEYLFSRSQPTCRH